MTAQTSPNVAYPFCAIVGQEDMKRALILNIINPLIGGVLIRGEKGTAKSTAVRGLADILPLRRQVKGCRFNCDPDDDAFWCDECRERAESGAAGDAGAGGAGAGGAGGVPTDGIGGQPATVGRMRVIDLPVSATEDRVVGTLDIEHALRLGEKRFEPGVLALANRNILYVDEVNLLEDHVVDVLLDAAALGVNIVEREGVSYSHPARFTLVGSMNPEEGDLRPQLIDRFGLVAEVHGEDDVGRRALIVRRRLDFERDPEAFCAAFAGEQAELGAQITLAQRRLADITYSDECLDKVAALAVRLGVDGHRADITLIKAALANAAFAGHDAVDSQDLLAAARLALPHRMRRRPFEEGEMDWEAVYEAIGTDG